MRQFIPPTLLNYPRVCSSIMVAFFVSSTILLSACTKQEAGSGEEEILEEDEEEERNVLKDYINTPKDRAKDLNKQLEERYKNLEDY